MGLWGGVKGWAADRLGRGRRDVGESSEEEDDEEVALDQSLDAGGTGDRSRRPPPPPARPYQLYLTRRCRIRSICAKQHQ